MPDLGCGFGVCFSVYVMAVCMCARVCAHVCVHTHVCVCVCMCVHTHVCVCVSILSVYINYKNNGPLYKMFICVYNVVWPHSSPIIFPFFLHTAGSPASSFLSFLL